MQWSWSRRPVWLVTPMVAYMTGMLAALGVAAAVFARRRGAPGQEVRVSGLRAAFALNSGTYVTGRETRGSLSQFGDPRGQMPTYSLFRTADGWLFIGALTPAFLVKLMTVLERVDLLADPRLQGSPLAFGIPEIKDFVRRELDPILATRTTAEWLGVLGAADIPCGPVRTREQALRDPEARGLGLVVPLEDPRLGATWQPGEPALFSDTPAPRPRPGREPGADTAAVRAAAPGRRGGRQLPRRGDGAARPRLGDAPGSESAAHPHLDHGLRVVGPARHAARLRSDLPGLLGPDGGAGWRRRPGLPHDRLHRLFRGRARRARDRGGAPRARAHRARAARRREPLPDQLRHAGGGDDPRRRMPIAARRRARLPRARRLPAALRVRRRVGA